MGYVNYLDQDYLFPSMFIGLPYWPSELEELDEELLKNVLKDTYDTVIVTEHQTSGVMCEQYRLFGVFFKLPENDELVDAAMECSLDVTYPAYWHELVKWESTLNKFGFSMEGTWYKDFQEAFATLNAIDAFEYVKKNADGVWTSEGELLPVDMFGSLEHIEEVISKVMNHLRDGKFFPSSWISLHLVGAVVYPNSD